MKHQNNSGKNQTPSISCNLWLPCNNDSSEAYLCRGQGKLGRFYKDLFCAAFCSCYFPKANVCITSSKYFLDDGTYDDGNGSCDDDYNAKCYDINYVTVDDGDG